MPGALFCLTCRKIKKQVCVVHLFPEGGANLFFLFYNGASICDIVAVYGLQSLENWQPIFQALHSNEVLQHECRKDIIIAILSCL